jgi:hypothetical protein
MKRRKFWAISISAVILAGFLVTLGLAAYSSHQNDLDVRNFLAVYPFAQYTKLDDCSLCHPGGNVTEGGKTKYYGSCDYCHITYGLKPPYGTVPLNAYGQAYKTAGRSEAAVRAIEGLDSDEDSFTNLAEIQNLSYPWDKADYPGLKKAPAVAMNMERILKLPDHSQFMYSNHSKSTDEYARYRGLKIKDLLAHVGLRPEATHITVFAPDGFSKTFPIDAPDPQVPATPPASTSPQYDVMGPYPYGYYYAGLDFVGYNYDPGYCYDGHIIPDRLYMMLGYLRDGDPLSKGKLVPDPKNPSRLVLEGEGPYRLVLPQKVAGSPDRPSTAAPVGDGWDYDPLKDHNAGSSVRSVTAIRVEPLPAGTTDFSWTESGWNLVDKSRVVIYGAIKPHEYPVMGFVTDERGYPIKDVDITIGLELLGQVEVVKTGFFGRFRTELPLGEYVFKPVKEGYTFEPESIPIQLSWSGHRMKFTAKPQPK